ncbi:CRISPR system precrRNA processing endoribonuclease RAMP protein Cas6 [Thermofilum sp.]|uniref:CRISPR system precrRNA processing endoribonuclease RAMP protein Cas6 n=1 Tax=Thermofilum sp. TaxID=1961369 RepID=UPI00319DB361
MSPSKLVLIRDRMLSSYDVRGTFEREYSPIEGFPGLALRGAFGLALRKLVCTEDFDVDCKGCKNYRSCPYALIFEPSSMMKPDAEIARKGGREGVTRPFVIEVEKFKGTNVSFGVTLIGNALNYEHVVIMAILGMGFEGLGFDKKFGERRKFIVRSITRLDLVDGAKEQLCSEDKGYILRERAKRQIDLLAFFEERASSLLHHKPNELTLVFKTPTSIRSRGRTLTAPSLKYVIANLARRYSLLAHYFGIGRPMRVDEARAVIQAADDFSDLKACNVKSIVLRKASIRGETKVLGSFVLGSLVYKLKWAYVDDDLARKIMALLLLGKHIHVGNMTTAGCGKYELLIKL